MQKGRSTYNFNLNTDVNKIMPIIQNFINEHKYQQVTKNGETYYRSGNIFLGYKYFNYHLVGNNIQLSAWLKNGTTDISLDNGGISVPIAIYKNLIDDLLYQINSVNK